MKSNVIWSEFNIKIMESKNAETLQNKYLYDGSKFTITNYICPCCKKRLLYKIDINNEFNIVTETGNQKVTTLFTCDACRAFYSNKINTGLKDGNGYKVEQLCRDKYFELLANIEP